jgi:ribonuclease D
MPEARRAGLVEAVSGALQLAEAEWPHLRRSSGVRLTLAQRKAQQQLQELRDAAAHRLGIDPSLIASRAMLVRLAAEQVDLDKELMPWQRELLQA